MRKTAISILIGLALSGCTEKKENSKAMLDDIIKVHDKVMGADEHLMNNKMKLDTLLKQDNVSGKDTIKMLITKLTVADSSMENWMHNFDPDHKGKSDDETAAYMSEQKKKIMEIDSLIGNAIAESNKYLVKIKAK
jgi:hypothetical protein